MWLGRDQTCKGGREALEVLPPQSLAGELLGTKPQFPHLSNRDNASPPTSRILLSELRWGGGAANAGSVGLYHCGLWTGHGLSGAE